MKRLSVVAAIALAGLWAVGAAAGWLPRGWLPDPGLVVAIALGLHVGGARGLALAWALGWTTDLLSAGPLGQHALLHLAAWGLTRIAARRVDLARPFVLAPFALLVSALEVAGLWLLGSAPADGRLLSIAVPFALANAAAALLLRPLMGALLEGIEAEELPRGSLRLDAGPGMR